jgi:hypothetical protein
MLQPGLTFIKPGGAVSDERKFRLQAIAALRKASEASNPDVRDAYCHMADDYIRKACQARLTASLAFPERPSECKSESA